MNEMSNKKKEKKKEGIQITTNKYVTLINKIEVLRPNLKQVINSRPFYVIFTNV